MECQVISCEMGLCVRCDLGQAACMLTFRAMFLHCWSICVVCLALKLIGSWVVVGFSVGMEAFGQFLLLKVPCSQEFSGALRFWA